MRKYFSFKIIMQTWRFKRIKSVKKQFSLDLNWHTLLCCPRNLEGLKVDILILYKIRYDSKCDIWSLGCVLYEIAALHPPFRATDLKDLNKKI